MSKSITIHQVVSSMEDIEFKETRLPLTEIDKLIALVDASRSNHIFITADNPETHKELLKLLEQR